MKTSLKDYLTLCKPRVIGLMILTTWTGMCLATTEHRLSLKTFILGSLGIAFSASAAAVINHIIDRKIDAKMHRTRERPLAQGRISVKQAFYYALSLACLGLSLLIIFINPLTTFLTFSTMVGYALFYSAFLKQASPQNIVIGGLFGAMPPLLGWTAVANQITANALLPVLIIFTWTPPHFWALAIHRRQEYAMANVPMLPVTHGILYTKLSIILYTLLLIIMSLLPYLTHMSGEAYLIAALLLGISFFLSNIKIISKYRRYDCRKNFSFFNFLFNVIIFRAAC